MLRFICDVDLQLPRPAISLFLHRQIWMHKAGFILRPLPATNLRRIQHQRIILRSVMVPRHAQVVPGAGVSIVLKEDQPTGRQVQGTVQNVLTKGDHPRGVKVRLSDGRVGRVQRMLPAGSSSLSGGMGTTDGRDSGPTLELHSNQPGASDSAARSHQKIRYRDVRLDSDLEAPPATNDLAAYIKPAKQKRGKRGKANSSAQDEAEIAGDVEASCPVCGEFKGDEAAVAHHVRSHFD